MKSFPFFFLSTAVLIDGLIWIILFIFSILALFNRINPPWLFISIWFFLHPLLMLIYFVTKFTLYYPPYRWSLQSWSIITTFLWLYQSLFFIYHSIIHGFLSDLSIVDGASAFIASGLAIHVWSDAFWTEWLQPFSFRRFGELQGMLTKAKKEVI